MYNNACSIAHSNGACSVNKVYNIKKKDYTLYCDTGRKLGNVKRNTLTP